MAFTRLTRTITWDPFYKWQSVAGPQTRVVAIQGFRDSTNRVTTSTFVEAFKYWDTDWDESGTTTITTPLTATILSTTRDTSTTSSSTTSESSSAASSPSTSSQRPSPASSSTLITSTSSIKQDQAASTTDPSSSTTESPSSRGHITPGEAAGIGIGTGIAFILLVAAVFIFFRRYRRKKALAAEGNSGSLGATEKEVGRNHGPIAALLAWLKRLKGDGQKSVGKEGGGFGIEVPSQESSMGTALSRGASQYGR